MDGGEGRGGKVVGCGCEILFVVDLVLSVYVGAMFADFGLSVCHWRKLL